MKKRPANLGPGGAQRTKGDLGLRRQGPDSVWACGPSCGLNGVSLKKDMLQS